MLFNSFVFWGFFLVIYALYWRLSRRWQNRLLLVASYVFYGYWDWRFLSLLAFSTLIDYWAGLKMVKVLPKHRRLILLVSLLTNLGLLSTFKYYDFFASELVEAATAIGVKLSLPLLQVILPVGISFYTFQTLSYTIDVYRGSLRPTRSLSDFALFVSFFPQLVAGPIERAAALLPQLQAPRRRDPERSAEGVFLIACGLLKKVVVADTLAGVADRTFAAAPGTLSGPEVLTGIYAFAFQIFCDFSGYSDMARGLAKLLGMELMVNFRQPYLAQNPSEFWRRWHISLSTWLRDYLYIPLGGNRLGRYRTYLNLLLTMLLGGLWHGAAWTFVLWGAFHGVLLGAHRWLRERMGGTPKPSGFHGAIRATLNRILMFHAVCFGWLLFRAASVEQVGWLASDLVSGWPGSHLAWALAVLTLAYALPVAIGQILQFDEKYLSRWLTARPLVGAGALALWMLVLLCFGRPTANAFIYFQF